MQMGAILDSNNDLNSRNPHANAGGGTQVWLARRKVLPRSESAWSASHASAARCARSNRGPGAPGRLVNAPRGTRVANALLAVRQKRRTSLPWLGRGRGAYRTIRIRADQTSCRPCWQHMRRHKYLPVNRPIMGLPTRITATL